MKAITENAVSKGSSKVLKKDYVLNDIEAIKNKLENCKRNPEIGIIGEAVDGSSTTVAVKTALFEYSRQNLISSIRKDTRTIEVIPTKQVISDTNFHGEANVEYQFEVRFKVNDFEHKVKVLCFATTCNILVQNTGGKS